MSKFDMRKLISRIKKLEKENEELRLKLKEISDQDDIREQSLIDMGSEYK